MKETKTYATRSVDQKLMGDAMKANKSVTTKRKKLRKEIMIDKENIKVAEIGEGNKEVDTNIAVAK